VDQVDMRKVLQTVEEQTGMPIDVTGGPGATTLSSGKDY
jgi:hypothetical protein